MFTHCYASEKLSKNEQRASATKLCSVETLLSVSKETPLILTPFYNSVDSFYHIPLKHRVMLTERIQACFHY